MKRENPDYFSFLLRIWQEKNDNLLSWRASLENPHNGERLGFSDVQKLFDYLADITEEGKSWNTIISVQKPGKNH